MKIADEPKYIKGQTFHAITEGDYLQYLEGYELKQLVSMAKEYWEDVYWCCQYPSGTVVERVYAGGRL